MCQSSPKSRSPSLHSSRKKGAGRDACATTPAIWLRCPARNLFGTTTDLQSESAQANEVQLLQAIAAGDEAALAQLYDQYRGILLGLLMRILGSREEAEDV